ncbi:MAG: DNA-binding transcriptional regulator [Deltaproteobacteria bacterium]|nr:MAG: DNA-binding transcriptional regulator [Deltaproteobacteria bacterium]
MRRADRLFQIIQLLRRRRRAVTARWLAEQLEVSERTIYRDVRDLMTSGTPIEGEAGVGYQLRRGYDLPPLMFDAEEIQALVLGARIVRGFADHRLAKAAAQALSKIENVLPKRLKPVLEESTLFAVRTREAEELSETLETVRGALMTKNKLRLAYRREDGEASSRTVRPLGAFFWGRRWTLTAWCELRRDFRSFRLDRMEGVDVLGDTFADEEGKSLRDYLVTVGGESLLDH